ncbi:5-hydroxyisourate hydrolase [Dictyobacter vulcani]|uniref:5-hydroxyisourate hydrolase n=1 Tax=Dictyobacter vulcani TaxID=2607529 RepID=A0A5J4KKM1_9CHLR|nr:hydroxyisourate hydrolase [Dictyobacter vulcani]GER90328.1 5-hydroxyisourate hydrolase [Dictyobacter vulcani]
MAGRLTTHVLDTMRGCPAADIPIQLWRLDTEGSGRTLLKVTRTNSDGRTPEALLEGHQLLVGRYELLFVVGPYFIAQGIPALDPLFLDEVPIRFGIADSMAHYHIPLLISPWAYSTYRGS